MDCLSISLIKFATWMVLLRSVGAAQLVLHSNKPAAEVYKNQPKAAAVLENDDITFFCSLPHDTLINTTVKSTVYDISFTFGDSKVSRFDISHENSSTASVTLRNVNRAKNGTIISCTTAANRTEQMANETDQMLLLVGVQVVQGLSVRCEAFDWKKMECFWTERDTGLFTLYELSYQEPGRSSWNECKNMTKTRSGIRNTQTQCHWVTGEQQYLNWKYYVQLCECTALDCSEKNCIWEEPVPIDTVKLAKVSGAKVTQITSRECKVTWEPKSKLMSRYGYIYEIFVFPRPSNRSWTTYDTFSEVNYLVPNTMYTMNIRVRNVNRNKQILGGGWSDNSTVKFTTEEDVPDANPETHSNAYTLEKTVDDVLITAYWKAIPIGKRNGAITYSVQLTTHMDGENKALYTTETRKTSISLKTKTESTAYTVYIKAMTSMGSNVLLKASKIDISSEEPAPKVRFFALKNGTITELVWNVREPGDGGNRTFYFTIFICKGTRHKCDGELNYIDVENATNIQLRTQEGARYGLVVGSNGNHQDRTRREVGTAASQALTSGIQWSNCYADWSEVKEPKPMVLSLSKSQEAESIGLGWTGVPCFAKTLVFHWKSATNPKSMVILPANEIKTGYHVIKGLKPDEVHTVYATWRWEFADGFVKSNIIEYTVSRSGLSTSEWAAVGACLVIVIAIILCGCYGTYRKCHKTVKEEVDIAVPEKQQFQRIDDMDLIDREDYTSLAGITQQPDGPRQTLLETSEIATRRITLDDPISDEHRRQNVYHIAPSGAPASAWRQRSQSLESGRPKWQPPSRFRSNSVVETQQQMDAMSAAMARGQLRRPSLESSSSFTEEENGSIYFRMDSNMGSQSSLNSASGPCPRQRTMSVSSVGSAASSFLWMSNSNEDLVDLSPPDNTCHYKITASGPYSSNDGYLKPRTSPLSHRKHLYKNFSVIREEDEESEYVPSSKDDPYFPMDPLDAEVADANYMAMSNNSSDAAAFNNMTYDYPKSYRSLTRGRLLSVSSVGSGVLLDEDFEDENDPYRIAATPVGRQQRSMSFDVASSGSIFTRPRSASVDVLDNKAIQTSLLRQRLSDDNDYMKPDIQDDSSDNIYLNTERADVNADDCHYKNMSGSVAFAKIPECLESEEKADVKMDDCHYKNISGSAAFAGIPKSNEKMDVKTDNCHYKNMSGSVGLAKIPERSESKQSVPKWAEDYLAPISLEKHKYSLVQDDQEKARPPLERQYSVISDEENEVTENGHVSNNGTDEHPYEMAF